ncbi:MAG: polysaccharide biosynthesis/export family protein [Opitutaceae bacterium]|nr:polysaccharide biosynthesis/export family protein [Opitutaceae bacterium]
MNQNGLPVNLPDTDPAAGANYDYERGRHQNPGSRRSASPPRPMQAAAAGGPTGGPRPAFSIDAWSLLRPAARRWYWLLFGGVLGAVGGGVLGLKLWTTYYTAGTQIVRFEPPVATDAYRPMQLHGPTLVGMISSGEIFRGMAQKMKPPMSPGELSSRIRPVPERQSDIVTVQATGSDPRSAIDLANAYTQEVIAFTQEHQRKEAVEADRYVTEQLRQVRADLLPARKAFDELGPIALAGASSASAAAALTPAGVANRAAERLQAAQDELAKLLAKYTDIHPAVKAQRANIAQIQAEMELQKTPLPAREADTNAAEARPGTKRVAQATREEWELIFLKVREFENLQRLLQLRQNAIQTFKSNPPGNFKVMLPASLDTVARHDPWIKVTMLAAFCGLIGMVVATGEVLRREILDTRLKTESDVNRVTGLPVLATLGDLRRMSLSDRESWAFRTWIALQDRLAYSPNHGLICGITSSNSGDGRSTWINLLAGAARKCGFRVLTIATRPTADVTGTGEDAAEPVVVGRTAAETVESAMAGAATNGHAHATRTSAEPDGRTHGRANGANGGGTATLLAHPNDLTRGSGFAPDSDFTALTASALFTPAMVTEKLMGTETDPLVHIPLPGWTWNLERRKQWQGALNVWRKIDNVVILVELPPASMAESVLLASNLPNLAWLVESGKSDAVETRAQLQTLRHARCNLVGAFVNRAMTPVAQGRFSRWVGCLTLLATLTLGLADHKVFADDASVVVPASNPAAFSIVSPTQRASWQKKLTLGPGDILNFSLYGEPELAREQVMIAPDGRVTYLEAQDIMAAGLTVDEFREKLNEELGKYRRTPQAFVVPVAYKSKKYFVLGRVAQRGAFPLDRPTTLLEAVARSGGMETGMASDRSLVEMADLSRSFLARNGQRMKVDFEKLFLHGDLTQNVPLEPDDYIYFPGGGEKEVFVLGAVRAPGPHTYNASVGVLGAIAGRGGFSDRAWTKKLLVIRGGLGAPETFKIDAIDVLSGRSPDIVLQPRDIVFVSDRPWIYAEELLDAATNAFVTSAIVVWTGEKITPLR